MMTSGEPTYIYRACPVRGQGRADKAIMIEAAGDAEAIKMVGELEADHDFDLWDRGRRVIRIATTTSALLS